MTERKTRERRTLQERPDKLRRDCETWCADDGENCVHLRGIARAQRALKHPRYVHPYEYDAWQAMKQRCSNPRLRTWKDYGGRGIRVCDEWRASFFAFFDHIGPRPSSKHSVDRIDVNGHYEPGNVRWATPLEQARNRRVCRG
jgi:hypothetical protein